MTVPKKGAPSRSIAERLRSIPKKRAMQTPAVAQPVFAIPADDVFASIRRNRNTQLPNQRAAIALMDATEAALHARGLPFVPASYWTALFAVLTSDDRKQHVATAVYLLSLVAPRMTAAEMLASYSDVYAQMPRLVVERQADAPFVRAALVVIVAAASAVLAADDAAERPSVRELLRILVALAADARPKVRHLAQSSLGTLYASPALPAAWRHDAADAVIAVLNGATRKEHTEALHAMPLARVLVLGGDDANKASALLAAVCRCTTLGNAQLSVLGLHTVAAFFEAAPCAVDSDAILSSLLASRPDAAADVLPAWLAAVASVPSAEETALVPVLECFGVAAAASSDAVLSAVENAVVKMLAPAHVSTVVSRLVRWLAVKNARCVPNVIRVLGKVVDVAESTMDGEMYGLLVALGDAHDGKQGRHAALIEGAVGVFVRHYGPEAVVDALPLNLVETGVRPRAWLLAVIRDCASHCRVAFFADTMLPLASTLKERIAEHEAAGRVQDAKVYAVVVQQIWATLSSFLNAPLDAAEALPRVGQAIAEVIAGDADLRSTVLAALTSFVVRSREAANDDLRFFVEWGAPRFVPLLFNVFAATAPEARAGTVAALEAVVSVLPAATQDAYLSRVVSKLHGVADDAEQVANLLELAAVLVHASSVAASSVVTLFGDVLRLVRSDDVPIAKRAYRVLGDLLQRDDLATAVVASHCDALEEALLPADGSETPSAAKRGRFRVLLRIVELLPADRLHWMPLVLPEVVFGVKEANVRTRGLAFELVLAMARRMVRGGVICAARSRGLLVNDASASLDEYVTMLMAGLAGRTPHMVSATILALARVLYDMHTLMVEEGMAVDASDNGVSFSAERASVVVQLLADMVALLGSQSREIAKAVLGFIKVSLAVLPADLFLQSVDGTDSLLGGLVRGVLAWQGAHQMHFKERVRHLLERLVRRYGHDAILALTPADHHKLLHAIRKRREQQKRRRERAIAAAAEGVADEENEKPARSAVEDAIAGRNTHFEDALDDSESEGEIDDALLEAAPVDESIARDLGKRLRLAASLAGDGRRKASAASAADTDDDEDGVAFDAEGKLIVANDDYNEGDAASSDDEDAVTSKKTSAPAAKRRRAGGDVRRSTDRFEPYAYVPMARSVQRAKQSANARFFKHSKKH